MTRQSYSLDAIELGEQADFDTEAVSYDITEFGWINTAEVVVERAVNQFKGLKGGTGGHLYQRNIQLLTRVTGTMTFNPIDLKFLKYGPGDYNEAAGNYTVASQADIPVFLSLKGNYDGTKAVKLIGLAFGNMNITVSENNIVEVSCPFTAKSIDIITESIDYTQPTVDPLTYIDGSLTYNSNNLLINSATVNMDLKAFPKRNFENVAANSKYYISSITRTAFICNFTGNADVEDATNEIEDFLGGTNGNIEKSDFDIVLNFVDDNSDAHSLTVSGCRDTRFRKPMSGDPDNIKNYDVDTVSLDISATGVV